MYEHTEADFERRTVDGFPERHAHKMPGGYIWNYERELIKYGQLTPIRPIIKAMFDALHKYRSQNTQGYKHLKFVAVDETKYEVVDPDGSTKLFEIESDLN